MNANITSVKIDNGYSTKSFKTNGVGLLITREPRSSPKPWKSNIEAEKDLRNRMSVSCFDANSCPAYQWLKSVTKGKMSKRSLVTLASTVAYTCDIPFTREYYRSKGATVFWLQEHFTELQNTFTTQQVEFM